VRRDRALRTPVQTVAQKRRGQPRWLSREQSPEAVPGRNRQDHRMLYKRRVPRPAAEYRSRKAYGSRDIRGVTIFMRTSDEGLLPECRQGCKPCRRTP
jgi:hypothetical protein